MPVQLFAEGVTDIVAICGTMPVLIDVNEGGLPVPLAARPIVGFEFVQAKVLPGVGLENVSPGTTMAGQTVISAGTSTVGVGFTVIVYVDAGPTQVLAVGTTEIVAVIVVLPVLDAVNPAMSPVPLAARPMLVFEFVQA